MRWLVLSLPLSFFWFSTSFCKFKLPSLDYYFSGWCWSIDKFKTLTGWLLRSPQIISNFSFIKRGLSRSRRSTNFINLKFPRFFDLYIPSVTLISLNKGLYLCSFVILKFSSSKASPGNKLAFIEFILMLESDIYCLIFLL